jgi:MtN3 and saliva related transmembrane protein
MATTSASIAQLLGTAATAYGVLAALSVLLQARQMLARRASCEVSGRFFASYAGGYAIWLLYGLSVSNVPLIVVDAVGLLCAGLTLAVALSLRGSLIHPTTWTSCGAIPVSEESSELVTEARTPSLWVDSRPTAHPASAVSGYEVPDEVLRAGWPMVPARSPPPEAQARG